MGATGLRNELLRRVPPGGTIAIGDGVGTVGPLADGTDAFTEISTAAREIGDVRLVLGWLVAPAEGLDTSAFASVTAMMPGWGTRDVLAQDHCDFVPGRLSGWRSLLADVLRPDVLITRVARVGSRHCLTSEVSWQLELAESGVPVLGVSCGRWTAAPAHPLPGASLTIAATAADTPRTVAETEPTDLHTELAQRVAAHIPDGARLQYGPGALGTALLRSATRPLVIDTGMLTDAVIDLQRNGMLAAAPTATYLFGSERLHEWAAGRDILQPVGFTHDIGRLAAGAPFVAVNTAIEIDPVGNVNVEGIGDKVVGGIGGHPDYMTAGHLSRGGLSVIAVPSTRRGTSPLVPQLSRPVSTPAHDVDLVVTERGSADLRGLGWGARQDALERLFNL